MRRRRIGLIDWEKKKLVEIKLGRVGWGSGFSACESMLTFFNNNLVDWQRCFITTPDQWSQKHLEKETVVDAQEYSTIKA